MRRFAEEKHIFLKRKKRNNRIYGERVKHFGFFRKWKGLGCRRARCLMCHYSKIFKIKKRDEVVSDVSVDEQMRELQDSLDTYGCYEDTTDTNRNT